MQNSDMMKIVAILLTFIAIAPLFGKVASSACGTLISMGVHTTYCSYPFYADAIAHSEDAYEYYLEFKDTFDNKSINALKIDCEGMQNLLESTGKVGQKEDAEKIITEYRPKEECDLYNPFIKGILQDASLENFNYVDKIKTKSPNTPEITNYINSKRELLADNVFGWNLVITGELDLKGFNFFNHDFEAKVSNEEHFIGPKSFTGPGKIEKYTDKSDNDKEIYVNDIDEILEIYNIRFTVTYVEENTESGDWETRSFMCGYESDNLKLGEYLEPKILTVDGVVTRRIVDGESTDACAEGKIPKVKITKISNQIEYEVIMEK